MTALDSKAGPLAYGIETFAKAAGIGRDAIYGAIREGRLTARKVGSRTIILREDGEAWLRSLPVLPAKAHDSARSAGTAAGAQVHD
jgi:excisionase family DNA binding protein